MAKKIIEQLNTYRKDIELIVFEKEIRKNTYLDCRR